MAKYKNILITLIISLLFLVFQSCGSSDGRAVDRDRIPDWKKNKQKIEVAQEILLHEDFEAGKRKFFLFEFNDGQYYLYKVTKHPAYRDSVRDFYTKNIHIAIEHGKTSWALSVAKTHGVETELLTHIKDSLRAANEQAYIDKELMERKWVYLGNYYGFDKDGYSDYYLRPVYYDIYNLLYEADSVAVVLMVGDAYESYKYVSINLNTKEIHGIDASSKLTGKSYNFIWDGDWWRGNDEFADHLHSVLKEKPVIDIKPPSHTDPDYHKSTPQNENK